MLIFLNSSIPILIYRDHTLNSPLYNLSHLNANMHAVMSSLSMLNSSAAAAAYVQSMTGSSGTQTTTTVGLGLGISSQFSAAGLKADGSSNSANSMLLNDGPPTPTQEMDMVGGDHRKCECHGTPI